MKLYSVEQAHEMFLPGMSTRHIRRACQSGDIAASKYGGIWLIRESSIRIFQERLKVQRGAPLPRRIEYHTGAPRVIQGGR